MSSWSVPLAMMCDELISEQPINIQIPVIPVNLLRSYYEKDII